MADRTNTNYESKSIPTYDRTKGTSIADILSFAAGKKAGEKLTIDDIQRIGREAGVSAKDMKSVIKGGKNFLASDKEYRLGDDGYNVFNKDGAETRSSREAGNKKGLNIGDVIGLGNKTSSLAGLAALYKDKYQTKDVKPNTPTPTTTVEIKEPIVTGDKEPATQPVTGAQKTGTQTGKKQSTQTGSKQQVTGFTPRLTNPAEIERQRIANEVALQNQGLSRDEYMGYIERFRNALIENSKGTWLKPDDKGDGKIFGVSTGVKGGKQYIDEAVNRFADDLDKLPRKGSIDDIAETHFLMWDHQLKNNPLQSEGDMAVDMAFMGLAPAAGATIGKGLGFAKASPYMNYFRRASGRMNTIQMHNQLAKASSITSRGTSAIIADPVKQGLNKLQNAQVKNISFPNTNIYPETNPARMIPAKGTTTPKRLTTFGEPAQPRLGTWGERVTKGQNSKGVSLKTKAVNRANNKMIEEGSPLESQYVNPNVVYKGTNPNAAVIKARSQQMVEGFRKGGKMMGATGLSFDWLTNPADVKPKLQAKAPTTRFMKAGFNPKTKLDAENINIEMDPETADTPKWTAEEAAAIHSRAKANEAHSTNYQVDKLETNKGGWVPPRENNLGQTLMRGTALAAPWLTALATSKMLDKIGKVKYNDVNPPVGVVTDMARPNFKLRSREPQGNDLQTREGGLKFADAQERDARLNFEVMNAQSRIGQQRDINQNIARNDFFNAQNRQQTEFANQRMDMHKQLQKSQNWTEAAQATVNNLAGFSSQDAYTKADSNMALAQEYLRRPEGHSEAQKKWAEDYLANRRNPGLNGRRGLKFRI
jgi:hypothetical protein